jgi:hypothetical protein
MHATCSVHAFLKFRHCLGRAILQAYAVDTRGFLTVLHRSSGNRCSLHHLQSLGISGEFWDLTQYSLNSRLMRLPLGHQGGKWLLRLYMPYISGIPELMLMRDVRGLRACSENASDCSFTGTPALNCSYLPFHSIASHIARLHLLGLRP